MSFRFASMTTLLACMLSSPAMGQTDDLSAVIAEVDASTAGPVSFDAPWWHAYVVRPQRTSVQPMPYDISALMFMAMQHSDAIKIAQANPVIRQTEITTADSDFDWVAYLNTAWDDTSLPVSTNLQAGGTASRLNDQIAQGTAGFRRRTRTGGQFDIGQRFGWQDNNSVFFTPGRQATSQFTISYTQPLMRGRGKAYNTSLIVLAQQNAESAEFDLQAVIQTELLEIVRSYWAMYVERATMIQQAQLYLKTRRIVDLLAARQAIDAQRTQLVVANAALENRRSDLIRARTAVTNAETRLRGQLNVPSLANSDAGELIPLDSPSLQQYPADLRSEVETALQRRPEAASALQQVRAAATRQGIAKHELLPALNLVTQFYTNGLRGQSNFGSAFNDQWNDGRPSYSIGLQYEMPISNRRAKAQLDRRQVELQQIQRQYKQALEKIQTEVDIAVRELNTSWREIGAKQKALAAAQAEANTIELRWSRHIDGNGSASLNLESLLRAQERVTQAEKDLTLALVTYSLATVNLKRSTGTLVSGEAVAPMPLSMQPGAQQQQHVMPQQNSPQPAPADSGVSMRVQQRQPQQAPTQQGAAAMHHQTGGSGLPNSLHELHRLGQ